MKTTAADLKRFREALAALLPAAGVSSRGWLSGEVLPVMFNHCGDKEATVIDESATAYDSGRMCVGRVVLLYADLVVASMMVVAL